MKISKNNGEEMTSCECDSRDDLLVLGGIL